MGARPREGIEAVRMKNDSRTGALGLVYWITLLYLGKSPTDLLHVMPVTAGIAFGILFLIWLITIRRHKPAAQS